MESEELPQKLDIKDVLESARAAERMLAELKGFNDDCGENSMSSLPSLFAEDSMQQAVPIKWSPSKARPGSRCMGPWGRRALRPAELELCFAGF